MPAQFQDYQALIRSMRPRSWDDVIGQLQVVRPLRNMILRGKIPQTILLEGDRGLGKTTCARLLAARINCREVPKDQADPCGKCPSCVGIIGGATDFVVSEIDCGTSNKVDDIVSLIGQSGYGSGNRTRVFILDEFHHVTTAGKTALLKPLEEPNPNVRWILCTTEGHKITGTIRSRCTALQFRPINEKTIKAFIQQIIERLIITGETEVKEFDDAALVALSELSDGSVRQALSLVEQVLAFGGEILTPAVVELVSGKATSEQISRFVMAIVKGRLAAADRLIREAYTDEFTDALLTYLYRVYIPGRGGSDEVGRRQSALMVRAVQTFQPHYSHSVNRDGLLFALYDALHGIDDVKVFEASPEAKTTSAIPEMDELEHINQLVALAGKTGPVAVAEVWDGNRMIIELGKKKVPVMVMRPDLVWNGMIYKVPEIPEQVRYVILVKHIDKIINIGEFQPKELIANKLMYTNEEARDKLAKKAALENEKAST